MAAGLLVTLYEYSPLFSITVVSLCFLVTAAMVLGWFGIDVPVILRSSDETESGALTPERPMVQVTNPFALELGSGPAGVSDGVSLRPCCLEPCTLTCFWGCGVAALQGALQAHQRSTRLSSPRLFQRALQQQYDFCQSFHVGSGDQEELHTRLPVEQSVSDFGLLPRQRYPLVAVLTAAETRASPSMVASVTVIHVPDDKYTLSARVLFQYLLTSQGSMYELKPLFMSADPSGLADLQPVELSQEPDGEQQRRGEEGEVSTGCVVCQNAAVSRVLLPCRHACVCDSCVPHFQHCPICRAFILESFSLTQR